MSRARPDPAFGFCSGPAGALANGITPINAPGHFDSSAMLPRQEGAEGRGVLLVRDIILLVPVAKSISFMRGYLNFISIPARTIAEIERATTPSNTTDFVALGGTTTCQQMPSWPLRSTSPAIDSG